MEDQGWYQQEQSLPGLIQMKRRCDKRRNYKKFRKKMMDKQGSEGKKIPQSIQNSGVILRLV